MPTPPSAPDDLIASILAGNVIAFIGAGLSQAAGLPGWSEAVSQLLDWGTVNGFLYPDRSDALALIQRGDLLTLVEDLREFYGKRAFHEAILAVFRRGDGRPTNVHRLLTEISFRAILTTNYDTLIETAYTMQSGSQPAVYLQTQEAELSHALRDSTFHIMKVHGSINHVESIVLGRSDYREILHRNEAYRTYLKTIFATKTVLFLGFSVTDPDIEAVLSQLQAEFSGFSGNHVALMPLGDGDSVRHRRLAKDYGIRVIPYPPDPGHIAVERFILDLRESVRTAASHASGEGRFVALQVELASELQRLEALHGQISTPEYLSRVLRLTKRLWDCGSRRSAWTTLSSAIRRSNGLDLALRATMTAELAQMMIEDAEARSAIAYLKPLLEEISGGGLADSALVYKIRLLWARCSAETYAFTDAELTFEAMLREETDPARRAELSAPLAEIYLLKGELVKLERLD